jgi:hypothetical protein
MVDTPEPPGSWIPFKIKMFSDEMPLMIVMQISMASDRQQGLPTRA